MRSFLAINFILVILSGHVSAGKQIMVLPGSSKDGLGILEIVSYSIVGEAEVVSFDSSMKIGQNLGSEPEEIARFARMMGLDCVLMGDVYRHHDKYRFSGVWIDNLQKNVNFSSLELPLEEPQVLVEQIVSTISGKTGLSIKPLNIVDGVDALILYDLGLYYKNKNDYTSARALFADALNREPGSLLSCIRLAQSYHVSGDNDEAYRTILTLPDKLPVVLDVFRAEVCYLVLLSRGAFSEAEQILESSVSNTSDFGYFRLQAPFLVLQANHFLIDRHDAVSAPGYVARARVIYEQLGDMKGVTECLLLMARWAMIQTRGNIEEEVIPILSEVEKLEGSLDYPHFEAMLGYTKAILGALRAPDESILEMLDRAEAIFLDHESYYSYIYTRMEHAGVLARLKRFAKSEGMLREVIHQAEKKSLFEIEIEARNYLGAVLRKGGNSFGAISVLNQNVEKLKLNMVPRLLRNTYQELIDAYRSMSYYDYALVVSVELLKMHEKANQYSHRHTFLLNNHGEILYLLKRDQEAVAYYNKAVDIKKKIGFKQSEAWTLRNLILAYARSNDLSAAKTCAARLSAVSDHRFSDYLVFALIENLEGEYERSSNILKNAKTRFPGLPPKASVADFFLRLDAGNLEQRPVSVDSLTLVHY